MPLPASRVLDPRAVPPVKLIRSAPVPVVTELEVLSPLRVLAPLPVVTMLPLFCEATSKEIEAESPVVMVVPLPERNWV